TARIYPLSLHDALPICQVAADTGFGLRECRLAEEEVRFARELDEAVAGRGVCAVGERPVPVRHAQAVALERVVEHPVGDEVEARSEEHTSELQSLAYLV